MDYTQILIYIVIAVVIIAILYYLFKHYKSQKIAYYESETIVSEKQNASIEKIVSGSTIPSPLQGNEYTISMWLYINDYEYKYGQPKHILYRGVDKNDNIEANPHIFLHPTESTLMIRIKLQSETVNDPNAHMVKVNVADPSNNSYNNSSNNKSNVSGNEITNVTANNVAGTENFYSDLGNNVLDSTIKYDHMIHNYAIVDLDDKNKIDNCQTQIREMFEDTPETTNPIINELPNESNNTASNNTASNNTILNPSSQMNTLSDDFIANNPFIAAFRDRFAKAVSDEERTNIAAEYADKFVDKTKDEKELIADQFLKTLAHMFATSMGLKVVNNSLMSKTELSHIEEMSKLYDTCYLRNIPLQKWVNITVSVYQNTVDIYMDGRLGASHNLKGFPQPNNNNVVITPKEGFSGYIANTNFYNMAVTPEKALEIYQEGPTHSDGFFTSIKNKVYGS